jgi:hypothetical protein
MRAGLDELTVEYDEDGVEIRGARWGDMAVDRMRLAAGTDLSPSLAALPDGLCSGDHYGVVLEGDITVRYGDGTEETTRAGELYYWPAGHTARTEGGVVCILLTPLAQVERMEQLLAAAAS